MATDAEITAALSGDNGALSVRFRYERQTKAGVALGDITDAVRSCHIDLDNERAIRRTASFVIDPTQASIDTINECIAVTEEIFIDGSYESVPMGLFRLPMPREVYAANGRRRWHVEAVDLNSILIDNMPTAPTTVASGTSYMGAVQSILTTFGLRYQLPTLATTTPAAFTWAQGTPWLTIVNDLLFGVNYYPIAPNASGVMTTRERVDPATWTEAIHYQTSQLIANPPDAEPFVKERDRTRYANRATVKISDPVRTPVSATRNNNDSNSAISQVSTGQIVLQEYQGGRVKDTTVAAAIAASELREFANRETQATLLTVLDPRRDLQETIKVTIPGIESGTLWQARGWSAELRAGAVQTHRLQRALSISVSA